MTAKLLRLLAAVLLAAKCQGAPCNRPSLRERSLLGFTDLSTAGLLRQVGSQNATLWGRCHLLLNRSISPHDRAGALTFDSATWAANGNAVLGSSYVSLTPPAAT